MKRVTAVAMMVTMLLSVVFGSAGCKNPNKEWYKGALEYYGNGIKNGFGEELSNLHVAKDLKKPGNKCGYLLRDLDGDGIDELLIGLIDDGIETKFTSVVVRHSGLGPYCLLSGGDGYYIYLCSNNVLRVDSWYGSATKKEYMQFDHKSNAFTIIDGEGKYLPMKWELTAF